MKVLQIYKDYYPPVKGGIEGHINLLANSLKKRRIGVKVLVSNTRAKLSRENINGIPVTKVPQLGRLGSAPLGVAFPFWLQKSGRDADILHFHFPNPTAEFSYLFSGLKKNIILTYHSDIVRQAKIGLFYTPFLKMLLRKTKAIIATSPNYVKSSKVLSQFQSKCKVVPLGIDLSRFEYRKEYNEKISGIRRKHGPATVLFVGRFRYYKGLHVLVESMKKIHAKLLLIGTGPLEKNLRDQVASYGLTDKIDFLGELQDEEVNIYLHACDLLVLPSILRSEAFGMVLLEAMACGKPVVSTELGTGTSFVNQHRKTGLVVPPNDVEALSDAVNYLLSNPKVRQTYGNTGIERVKKYFLMEDIVNKIIEIYDQTSTKS